MSTYALIDTVSPNSVLRRRAFSSAEHVPTLAPEKGVKWIPDNPPAFDPATQTREVSPVPVDATEVPYVVVDIPLATVKAARKAALANLRWMKETGGTIVGGIAVATDRGSQAMLTGAKKALEDGLIAAPIDWKADGGFVQIDGPTLAAIAGAAAVHIQACFTREKELSAAIDAGDTAAAVLAVDLDSGWPG